MFKLRTLVALLVVAFCVALLGTVIDPEGVLFLVATAVAVVLVSFTDPYTFGWTNEK